MLPTFQNWEVGSLFLSNCNFTIYNHTKFFSFFDSCAENILRLALRLPWVQTDSNVCKYAPGNSRTDADIEHAASLPGNSPNDAPGNSPNRCRRIRTRCIVPVHYIYIPGNSRTDADGNSRTDADIEHAASYQGTAEQQKNDWKQQKNDWKQQKNAVFVNNSEKFEEKRKIFPKKFGWFKEKH